MDSKSLRLHASDAVSFRSYYWNVCFYFDIENTAYRGAVPGVPEPFSRLPGAEDVCTETATWLNYFAITGRI